MGGRFKPEYAVAVASANELENKLDRWFLGLPDKPTDIAVLLCRSRSGKVNDIVLPVAEVEDYWNRLSRSGGQIKFNVRRIDGSFVLLIPHGDRLSVARFLGRYDLLN